MAKAIAKYIRMSPRKVRRVVDVIRGKDVSTARTILRFMPQAAAKIVQEVLKSAVANAKENANLNPEELKVAKAFVDESPVFKRWRAMSRGRGYQILKRNSHITIEVENIGEGAVRRMPKAAEKAVKEKLDEQTKSHKLTVDNSESQEKPKPVKKTKKVKKEKAQLEKEDSSSESKSKGKKGKGKK
ncbi:MAG: 50S ribosomal protein L22 [Candidatus Melainabacteria bacterium]|nr:50S ribosomal protein L22 [Candidatus Melainabacteria bacterium]MBI3308145.1 50S ribosomal protein L22 [Candidatus Melainabacteria bacterium]